MIFHQDYGNCFSSSWLLVDWIPDSSIFNRPFPPSSLPGDLGSLGETKAGVVGMALRAVLPGLPDRLPHPLVPTPRGLVWLLSGPSILEYSQISPKTQTSRVCQNRRLWVLSSFLALSQEARWNPNGPPVLSHHHDQSPGLPTTLARPPTASSSHPPLLPPTSRFLC